MGKEIYKISKYVLWRSSDDDSVLVLLETSGRAFVIPGDLKPFWDLLVDGADIDVLKKTLPEMAAKEQERFFDGLMTNQIICKNGQEQDVRLLDSSNTQPSAIPVHIGPIAEVSFGACDCSGGYPGLIRWLACEWGGENRTSSVIY
jgi:hypothetical protein